MGTPYNLIKPKVLGAFQGGIVVDARRVPGPCGPWLAIHKFDRALDRFGKGPQDQYVNVSYWDVSAYVHREFHHNDLFVLGTRVLRQKKGVAIGGMISAQLVSMYCMCNRHKHYEAKGAVCQTNR